MSAFIVNDNHINVIVSWFITPVHQNQAWIKLEDDYTYLTSANAFHVAQVLMQENIRSVNERYSEETPNQYTFTYIANAKAYSIAEIAGALDCLEYQSCETDDYHQTNAYELITLLRKDLLKRVQTRELGDDTTWEISEIKSRKVYLED